MLVHPRSQASLNLLMISLTYRWKVWLISFHERILWLVIHPVFASQVDVYCLVTLGTIEEKIQQLQESKKELVNNIEEDFDGME